MAPVLSPMAIGELARRTDATTDPKYDPGHGAKPANDFNNQLFLGLFAAIGAGMVLSTLWFFFMAKNGGFHWKKGDWEDYKSTVLRRKGPDGKTLSNATKSTKLGGTSTAPKFSDNGYTDSDAMTSVYDAKEMREMRGNGGRGARHDAGIRIVDDGRDQRGSRRQSSRHDPELAAYKHEKSAKVGGLNSAPAGSHYDYTNTDRSEVTTQTAEADKDKKAAKRARKEAERREKQRKKEEAKAAKADKKDKKKDKNKASNNQQPSSPPNAAHRGPPSGAYSFTRGDDTISSFTADTAPYSDITPQPQAQHRVPSDSNNSYYYNYRPAANLTPINEVPSRHSTPASQRHANRQSHNSSPSKEYHSSSRQGSPQKRHRDSARRPPGSFPGDDSAYENNSDTGTKAYPCHIPGLSSNSNSSRDKDQITPFDSVSQVGGPRRAPPSAGYRRGRGRDEMSETDVF